MYKVILSAVILSGLNAHAMKIDAGDNKNIYFSESGKKMDALEAYKAAMKDEKVLQCSYVEAVGNSRTGKVTLKKKQ